MFRNVLVTFKEDMSNTTVKRAYVAGSFFCYLFLCGFFCTATHLCNAINSNCRTWRSDKRASLLVKTGVFSLCSLNEKQQAKNLQKYIYISLTRVVFDKMVRKFEMWLLVYLCATSEKHLRLRQHSNAFITCPDWLLLWHGCFISGKTDITSPLS